MGKFFGTDGIRGVANRDLTCELAFKTGQAAAIVLSRECKHRAKIYIGKDTRISSDMLENALAAGISSVGAEVGLLGFIPTPAVAYLTVAHGADAGVVISASHNPMEFNGIKIFGARGYKLPDAIEDEIESIILGETPALCVGAEIGRVRHMEDCAAEYERYITKTIDGDLSGLRVLFDCANGASFKTAPQIFEALGIDADFIHNDPNGININANCGSTHMGILQGQVVSGGYDAGIAFDGDADRCLVVDETGAIVDGDRIMAVCANALKRAGKLPHDTFVATVMSNLGLHAYAKEHGLHIECAAVGDRNVLEMMQRGGFVLGGEQSGHVIFLKHSTTGDGELTAVQYLKILKDCGMKASELTGEIEQYPQVIINISVKNECKASVMQNTEVCEIIKEESAKLGNDGRIFVRASGTEPLVRVMVEGKEPALVNSVAGTVANVIERVSK